MRWLPLMLLLAAFLAAPAAGSSVKAGELVLQESDVPRGYDYDKDNSVALPRAPRDPSDAEARRLIQAGFQSGSIVRYTRWEPRWTYINSFAFVFKDGAGAAAYFTWLDKKSRTARPRPIRRGGLALGANAKAHVYGYAGSEPGTFVFWRRGRVLGAVSCHEMRNHDALARVLARTQDRRIVTALR